MNRRNNNPQRLQLLLIISQFVLLAIPFVLYYQIPVLYVSLITDDQFGEWATFAAYGLSSLLLSACFFRYERTRARMWFGLRALIAFLIAMEEISWGQRILGLETPELLLSYNFQGEIGFQNIRAISPDSLTYFVVAAAVFLYAMLPIAYKELAVVRRIIDWTGVPIANLTLIPILVGTSYFLVVSDLVKSDELGEYFLSLSILFLAAGWLSETWEGRPSAPILSLFVLSIILVAAAGLSAVLGRQGALIRRWHTTADRMVYQGDSEPALQIMQHVDRNPEYHRPTTPLILARALRAEGEADQATALLLSTAETLQAALSSNFQTSLGILLASVYQEQGETERAKNIRLAILDRLRRDVQSIHSETDEFAQKLLEVSEIQRALNLKGEAMQSLLRASRATRRASIINKIEWNLGALAGQCEQNLGKDGERRIPIDQLREYHNPDWVEFCDKVSQ